MRDEGCSRGERAGACLLPDSPVLAFVAANGSQCQLAKIKGKLGNNEAVREGMGETAASVRKKHVLRRSPNRYPVTADFSLLLLLCHSLAADEETGKKQSVDFPKLVCTCC